MTIGRRSAAACLVGLGLAVFLTQAGAAADPAPRDLWLRGAGATFPAPLYRAWIKAYEARGGNVSLTYDAIGSGAGLSQFVTGSVDFAGSDAPISDADVAKVERGVVSVPATAGMVVLAYSLPDAAAPLRLSREAYAGIFAGEITEWDDPRIQAANPGVELPNTEHRRRHPARRQRHHLRLHQAPRADQPARGNRRGSARERW